jgi:hypothetical protein
VPAEFAVLVETVFAKDVIVVLEDAGGECEGNAVLGLIFPIFVRIPLEPYRYTDSITKNRGAYRVRCSVPQLLASRTSSKPPPINRIGRLLLMVPDITAGRRLGPVLSVTCGSLASVVSNK